MQFCCNFKCIGQVICISAVYFIITVNYVKGLTSCSEENRQSDLEQCLNEIRNTSQSKDEFWFGNSYMTSCPQGPSTSWDCSNYAPEVKDSLVSRVFGAGYSFDESLIDRYLDVIYTTQKGQYTGCGNRWVHATSRTIIVDPLSRDYYHPFDTITVPQISWSYTDGDYYFLIVYDVGNRISHGVFINIQGNDVTGSEAIKAYAGPKNPRANENPYAFILFKQNGRITLSSEWRITLASTMITYNMSDVITQLGLQGPIAMNWVRIVVDPYSVQYFIDRQRSNNCAYFVTQELKTNNRSIIPSDADMSVFVVVQFRPAALTYKSCCTEYNIKAVTRDVNPLGQDILDTGELRTGVTPTVLFIKRATFPDATNFDGNLYTLITVDPDVPSATAGTQDRPILHWQIVNIPNGDVSAGTEVQTFRGPMPPDDSPHQYYFLLYEQTSEINSTSLGRYAGQNCSGSLVGRCLYDVNLFVNENNLKLVGASWFFAKHDAYVRYVYTDQYGRSTDDVCNGVPGYQNPCPVSSSIIVLPPYMSLFFISTILVIVNINTVF